jgi:hypothetical protein
LPGHIPGFAGIAKTFGTSVVLHLLAKVSAKFGFIFQMSSSDPASVAAIDSERALELTESFQKQRRQTAVGGHGKTYAITQKRATPNLMYRFCIEIRIR